MSLNLPSKPRWGATRRGGLPYVLALFLAVGHSSCGTDDAAAPARAADTLAPRRITALGRIEPKDGILRLAGSSRPGVVIANLLVQEGDRVQVGQPLAELDSLAADEAAVTKARAALRNAETELNRIRPLVAERVASSSALDLGQLHVDTARADLAAAQAILDLDVVRAPVTGQIVNIFARRGERIGPEGFAEIAQNDQMFAIAEVYETDIGHVKVGQHATVRSAAFDSALTGTVERIGLTIGKQDLLDTDPIARTDARVIEVRVKLDDSTKAAALSNLQVEVAIEP